MHVSILCPSSDVELDWRPAYASLSRSLEAAGLRTRALPWPEFADSEGNCAVACLAWGYHLHPLRWTNLLRGCWQTRRLLNPPKSLLWNSDKIYLEDLKGCVPIVPTYFAPSLDEALLAQLRDRFMTETLIAKPRWGATAYGLTVLHDRAPVPRLTNVLVQPKVETIETDGEVSLVYLDGHYSHAVRKVPAPGEFRVQSDFGGSVEVFAPDQALVALGLRALAAAPTEVAYARVDLVRGNNSKWQVMELELIEPELFLGFAPDDGHRFGHAIRRRLLDR